MVPVKKLERIEAKIKADCTNCLGAGCETCKAQLSRVKAYARIDIPMDYWMLAFKDFEGDPNFKRFIADKLQNIDDMYNQGSSLAFVGNLGTGKTYAACAILKLAAVSGYSSKYVNMSDIIQKTTENTTGFYEHLTNIDFLVIDEFDSRWVYPSEKAEQLFGQTMERILRERFQNKMPTIICSNTQDLKSVLADDFSRSIDSLFSNYLKVIYVSGRDFRKIQK